MGVEEAAVDGLVEDAAVSSAACRLCGETLDRTFVDLGLSPLANSYLSETDLQRPELFYPLRVFVCERCLLVQLPVWEVPEAIFSDYAYYSSYSDSWVEHARRYVEDMVERFGLGEHSHVVEVASNDGYLLQFVRERKINALGIDPAANVVAAAAARGVETIVDFFGTSVARQLQERGEGADLLVANNVLAHVPDVHDFTEGLRALLREDGVITIEVPWLLRLVEKREFDTIYHEHFSYFSLFALERLFADHGLEVFDVEELPTHGGSLRVYVQHRSGSQAIEDRVAETRALEQAAGLHTLDAYLSFDDEARAVKRELLTFLARVKGEGKAVAAYGAAAKGNTLLNYCGIRGDFLDYVVDRSEHKQGRYTPGTRLPIVGPDHVTETRPDYLLLLAWNLASEIVDQMSHVREWGCQFVVPIPRVELVD